MCHKITVGSYRLVLLESVKITRSVEALSDTAVIVLPGMVHNQTIEIEDKVKVGDAVKIELGYNDKLKTEFEGYVQRIGTDGGSIKLECEDGLWLFRKAVADKVYANKDVKDILKDIAGQCGPVPGQGNFTVEPTETVYSEDLDVYDSQNYKIRNIYLHALPFEKVQFYTRKSADSIVKKEIADAAYNYAPLQAGSKSIVLNTTGATEDGFKQLQLSDVLKLAETADRMGMPEGKRNLVLPSDWWWELVMNNEILTGQMKYQQANGVIEPKIVNYYGIKIHKSLGDKLGLGYDTNTSKKAAQGATITGTVCPAALFFCGEEVYKAGGQFEMFYLDKSQNPSGRAFEFGFQHRFKAGHQMSGDRYTGLLYKTKVI
ncbi:MAG: hypothetical protein IK013_08290 [Bacteroidales bacterium]|nr:hypothetical protein [Bacteroidales bacterium]